MVTTLLNAKAIAKFQNVLPNLLSPGLYIDATNGGTYDITMSQGPHDFGLGAAFAPTNAWGYGGFSYLGPTIVAQKGSPIYVNWINSLVNEKHPFQDTFAVDMTLHGAHESTKDNQIYVQPHLHGGLTQDIYDGNPFANPAFLNPSIPSGPWEYRNAQEAANIWYHDHALGITRLNVYAGLAGFYILRDNWDTGNPGNNRLGLPVNYGLDTPDTADDKYYEFPIVFQDKAFTSTGQLYYPSTVGDPLPGPRKQTVPGAPGAPNLTTTTVPEFAGDVIVVNGVAWPKLNVEPRTYRFRLLNGSDSRFYEFRLPGGLEFQVIGTDTGLLDGPAVPVRTLRMAPGERYDVIIDFSKQAGKTLTLSNVAGGQGSRPIFNDPQTTGQIMQFVVDQPLIPANLPTNSQWKIDLRPTTDTDPNNFIPIWAYNATTGRWDARNPNNPRTVLYSSTIVDPTKDGFKDHGLAVFEGLDPYGRIHPHLGTVKEGSLLWDDPRLGGVQATAAETAIVGEYTVFKIYNTTPDAHPIHLHGNEFQILERQNFKANLTPITITKTETDHMTGMPITGNYQAWQFTDANGDNLIDYRDITLLGKPTPPSAYEAGFKDTGIIAPGEVITVVTRFDPLLLDTNGNGILDSSDQQFGKYVWHCHILSHEDHEMMRPLLLTAAPSLNPPII